MKLGKQRLWLFLRLREYGYSKEKIAQMYNYSTGAIEGFFYGNRRMPEYMKTELLNIVYFENKIRKESYES